MQLILTYIFQEFALLRAHDQNPSTLTLSEAMRSEILYQSKLQYFSLCMSKYWVHKIIDAFSLYHKADGMTFELDENQNVFQNGRKRFVCLCYFAEYWCLNFLIFFYKYSFTNDYSAQRNSTALNCILMSKPKRVYKSLAWLVLQFVAIL